MTTIVFRAGMMCSDSRAYSGSKEPMGAKNKIHQLPNGDLVGISSTCVGLPEALRDWLKAGADIDNTPEHHQDAGFSILHVEAKTGAIYRYENGYYASGPLFADYYAIGSGAEFAMGAMAAGCDAIAAVTVAIMLDVWSGGSIQMLKLPVADGIEDAVIVEAVETVDS